jgi:transglutaminase-like putative cysteine protease
VLRRVSSTVRCTVVEPAVVELQVVAVHAADELLEVELDGRPLQPTEHRTTAGGRLHLLQAPPGELEVRYRASVPDGGAPVAVEPLDASTYLRPSRYAESDRLGPVALAELGGAAPPAELVPAVAAWVGTRLQYVLGASAPTDGAVETLLARRGVCRDFAHLTVALLRGLDVPARLVSVYAPGLSPMDFHAVAEALVDGTWCVVDPTLLAPRASLVRIATGRDAADTAFLSTSGGQVRFGGLEVSAVVDGGLPADDPQQLVRLS